MVPFALARFLQAGLEEHPRVGVIRFPAAETLDLQHLDDLALIHHGDPRAHMGDHGQIMADHQHGETVGAADPLQQIQDFRLHGQIERRCRFIEKQDARLGNQRPGNGHTLALTARELMRIAVTMLRSEADLLQCLNHAPVDGVQSLDRQRLR